jgi:hypothetical protein
MPEQVELTLRLGRGRKERVQLPWKHIFPIRNRLETLAVGILQAEDHADADLLISLHDRIEMPVLERIERQHVLNGGHAGAQAFQSAEQGAGAHFFHRARRILRRQRVETPGLERHFLECAFGQHIVRVVMGVDEAGQDEMPARVELVDRCAGDLGNAPCNAGDLGAGNGDIDRSRRMLVVVGKHGAAAADDQRGPGRNRLGTI